MLLVAITSREADVLSLGKISAQIMGGACLDGFFVLNHRLYGERHICARETLSFGFFTSDHWDRKVIAKEFFIELVDGACFLDGLLFGLMGGVAFLP